MDPKAREDLELIRRMMEDSRRQVVDRGQHFLIWGVVPALGLAGTYLHASGAWGVSPRWVWTVLLVLGWAASLLVGWREGRGARVSTLARRLMTATWVSAGVTMTLVGVAGMFGPLVDGRALSGLLAVVLAAPVMTTSLLTGERWLGLVAMGWWVGGGVMLFVPGIYSLLLMAGMSLVLLAVPGAVLMSRASRRRRNVVTDAA